MAEKDARIGDLQDQIEGKEFCTTYPIMFQPYSSSIHGP
jgi:hypothetical protein